MTAFRSPSIASTRTDRALIHVLRAGPLLLLTALFAGGISADEPEDLIGLINAFRDTDQACDGAKGAAVGPLAPADALAVAPTTSGAQLQRTLQASGYRPAKLQAVSISGPASAKAAMDALRQRYCGALRSEEFAEIGVSRQGSTWQVLLAKPLLSPDLGDWQEVGKKILKQVNEARTQARTCGSQTFEAVSALRWNDRLAEAALAHSRDMANQDFFSHRAPNGSQVSDRANRAGYAWSRVGENIAAGQGSVEQAVAGWLASPGHCRNIMRADFTEMGAAYATNPDSAAISYWTQVFGTPR